jgi:hypothetical protein
MERRLDRVEAARRLASLLNADGQPNPAHVARMFRVRQEFNCLLARLILIWRGREGRGRR